ncbi:DMT family transporter [Roseateles chitinivorans]|uniref:DMT family transporter n=1 Tax=Roseateles chitinivorans TaxID=2917965 RepID=UPI003D668F91
MSLSNPYAATVAMLFAAVSWGSLFLVGKPVLSRLDPIWFTALRYLLAGVGMTLLVVFFGQRPWAKLRAHWGTLTRYGVLGYGFFGILVLEGLKLSLPSHGAVLMATMPMTTILLRWLLDGQRPGIAVAGAAVLALSGVVLVSGVLGRTDGPPHMLLGDALTLLGTVGWVLYTRGAAKVPDLSPLEYTGLTAIAALPWQVAFALVATAGAGSPRLRGPTSRRSCRTSCISLPCPRSRRSSPSTSAYGSWERREGRCSSTACRCPRC